MAIKLPKTCENSHVVAYKQAKRRDDDIAIVNAAFYITFDANRKVKSATMAFGGMGPTTLLATKTSKLLEGKQWEREVVEEVTESLCDELPLSPGAPGGMVSYRRALVLSLFFKAFLNISKGSTITDSEKSGGDTFSAKTPQSTQLFEQVRSSQAIVLIRSVDQKFTVRHTSKRLEKLCIAMIYPSQQMSFICPLY